MLPVECRICRHNADSYPTGGSYAILDCPGCNGFFKISDTAVAVLEYPPHLERYGQETE